MANTNQTSLQQEFNRLSFLASIATGSTSSQSPTKQTISLKRTHQQSNGIDKQNSLSSSSAANDIGRISSLINSATSQTQLKKIRQPPNILKNPPVAVASPKKILTAQKNTGSLSNNNQAAAVSQMFTAASLGQTNNAFAPKAFAKNTGGSTGNMKTTGVILPANLAGVSGKVLIVNNPNQNTSSSNKAKKTKHQANKPVLLLPNNNNNNNTKEQQNTALQMIVNQNNQLPALQHIQSVSVPMSSLQTIRPKSSTARFIKPKQQQIRQNFTPVVSSSVTISPRNIISTNQNNVLVLSAATFTKPSTAATKITSSFDEKMTQHLQQLEMAEPHLFVKGGTTTLNLSSLGSTTATSSNNAAATQQPTAKKLLQLQKQQEKEQQQQIIKLAISDQQQQQQQNVITQKQQAALQNILKQQFQQQVVQKKQLQNLQESTLSDLKKQSILEQAKQQHFIHQNQQNQELLLLQQQLMQSVQQQQSQQAMLQQQQKQQQQSNKTNPQQPQQPAKLQINSQTLNTLLQQQYQQNAPLKLLSSLVSQPVNNTLNISQNLSIQQQTQSTTTTTTTKASKPTNNNSYVLVQNPTNSLQQSVRPVLVQLPDGNTILSTQIVNTSQLNQSQLVELQKQLIQQQQKQKLIQSTVKQQKIIQPNTSQTPRSAQPPLQLLNATFSNTLINNTLTASALQNRSLFALQQQQQNKKLIQVKPSSTIITSTAPPSANLRLPEKAQITKTLNEQLKNMSNVQKDQLLQQLASGKVSSTQLHNAGISSQMLIASILKNSPANVLAAKETQEKKKKENISTLATKVRASPAMKRPPPPPVQPVVVVENKMAKKWRRVLSEDQSRVTNTDVKTPFRSKEDAYARLIPYHILHTSSQEPQHQQKFEALFESFAASVQERKNWLMNKFNLLMFKEAQLACPSEELIQVARMFNANENDDLHALKSSLQKDQTVEASKLTNVVPATSITPTTTPTEPSQHQAQQNQQLQQQLQRQQQQPAHKAPSLSLLQQQQKLHQHRLNQLQQPKQQKRFLTPVSLLKNLPATTKSQQQNNVVFAGGNKFVLPNNNNAVPSNSQDNVKITLPPVAAATINNVFQQQQEQHVAFSRPQIPIAQAAEEQKLLQQQTQPEDMFEYEEGNGLFSIISNEVELGDDVIADDIIDDVINIAETVSVAQTSKRGTSFDQRQVIAHKDGSSMMDSSTVESFEESDEDDGENEYEEIQMDESSQSTIGYAIPPDDKETATATDYLLADLEQDDRFDLSFDLS